MGKDAGKNAKTPKDEDVVRRDGLLDILREVLGEYLKAKGGKDGL